MIDQKIALDMLADIFDAWLINQGLPDMAPIDLLHKMVAELTPHQRRYINAYIDFRNQILH
jgi:hypothetical protein